MGLLLWLCLQSPVELAERLRSDEVEARDEAFHRLLALGDDVRPLLLPLRIDRDPEVAFRAQAIVDRLDLHGRIDPRLLDALPGFARRWEGDGEGVSWLLETLPEIAESPTWDEGWAARAFLVAAWISEHLEDQVTREDLVRLALLALRDVDEETLDRGFLDDLGRYGLEETGPELLELFRSGSSALRVRLPRMLADLLGPDVVPNLVEALADVDDGLRNEVSEQLLRFDPAEVDPPLLGLLEGPLPADVRARAISLLRTPLQARGEGILARQLRHEDDIVRSVAARALLRLGARLSAEQLAVLLEDPSEELRWVAVGVLARQEEPPPAKALRGMLRDPSVTIRREVLLHLARLGDASAATEIVRLLEDREVRPVAIHALLSLDALNSLPDIRKYENDPDPYVQAQVTRALQMFGD